MGAEKHFPIGIRFPDRPARSESLYRLRYPCPHYYYYYYYYYYTSTLFGLYLSLSPAVHSLQLRALYRKMSSLYSDISDKFYVSFFPKDLAYMKNIGNAKT
jgi:hypothetical protein